MTASILIIDDEDTMRNLLSIILTRAGYQVSQASDSMEGLALIVDTSPDIVLLDSVMPGLPCVEVLRLIRQLPLPHQPKVIVSTVILDCIQEASQYMDDILFRPVLPDVLLETIRRQL